MGSSLGWLRLAVVLAWAAGAAGVGIDWWLEDSLPEPLRGYAPDLGSMSAELAELVALLVLLALLVAGSVGVLFAWPPARFLYTVGNATLLAVLPFSGARVAHGWAEPLYEIGSMASGAALALLYLSPAARAFGSAPVEPGDGPQRSQSTGALRTTALLAVGALAGIGALAIAAGFAIFSFVGTFEEIESEAQRIGSTSDDAACFAAARDRLRTSDDWFEGMFLYNCLSHATKTEAFCRDVPTIDVENDPREKLWLEAHCGDDAGHTGCGDLLYTVQTHCSERE